MVYLEKYFVFKPTNNKVPDRKDGHDRFRALTFLWAKWFYEVLRYRKR